MYLFNITIITYLSLNNNQFFILIVRKKKLLGEEVWNVVFAFDMVISEMIAQKKQNVTWKIKMFYGSEKFVKVYDFGFILECKSPSDL